MKISPYSFKEPRGRSRCGLCQQNPQTSLRKLRWDHLQCDGHVERASQNFSRILLHDQNDDQKNWDLVVPFAEWCMNNLRQETTGCTPFELVYGRKAEISLDLGMDFDGFVTVKHPFEYAGLVFQWLKTARDVAKAKIHSSHDVAAPRFNSKQAQAELRPGNLVSRMEPCRPTRTSDEIL